MTETAVTPDEVLGLLVGRIEEVLDLDADDVGADTRFDEDLHADSLDLVEMVEGVERSLRERGVSVALRDDELLTLRTVGEAAARIAAGASRQAPS